MKKFLSLILFIGVFCFCRVIKVEAIEMKATSNSVTAGDTFTINFSDAKLSDMSPLYVFSYDYMDNLERGVPVGFSGYDKLSFKADSGSITFKTKDVKSDYTVTFKIVDLNNEGDIKTESVIVKTKQVKTPTPSPTTQAPKSNNTNLKTLSVKADDNSDVLLSPSFKPNVYEYQSTVASTVKTIEINATLEDSKATMIISNNANEELVAGENNKITITVTAEDGTKRPYVINIKREALTADATLKELTIKEDESFKLKEDVFTYKVKVGKNVKELTISYVLSDENATVLIDGNENLKDGSKVRITVVAQDGTKKVYTLNIEKEKTTTKKNISNVTIQKNPLIIMALSIVAFGLIGGIIYVIKK